MAAEIDFYFDFISPYSYVAFKILERLQGRLGTVRYHPVRLPYIIKATGNHPPASVPTRRAFFAKDLFRTTRLLGIPFHPPKDFVKISLKSPALVLLAVRVHLGEEQVISLMTTVWKEFFGNGSATMFTDDPAEMKPLLLTLYEEKVIDELIQKAKSEEIESMLRQSTDGALAAGAFGVPTMLVTKDGVTEFFFGSDRFHHIAAFVKVDDISHNLFTSKL